MGFTGYFFLDFLETGSGLTGCATQSSSPLGSTSTTAAAGSPSFGVGSSSFSHGWYINFVIIISNTVSVSFIIHGNMFSHLNYESWSVSSSANCL